MIPGGPFGDPPSGDLPSVGRSWHLAVSSQGYLQRSPFYSLLSNAGAAKVWGYAVLFDGPSNAASTAKMSAWAVLDSIPVVSTAKVWGYTVLTPVPLWRFLQEWPNPLPRKHPISERGYLQSSPLLVMLSNAGTAKFWGFSVLFDGPANAASTAKMSAWAVLDSIPVVSSAKLWGFSVLTPAPLWRFLQEWPNPRTARRKSESFEYTNAALLMSGSTDSGFIYLITQ
jgi:hypothetical protein